MTAAQSALARRRLFLGITNVGFWVVVAFAGLLALATHRLVVPAWFPWWALGVAVVATQAIFDFVGGVVLMPDSGPNRASYRVGWSRGVLVQTLVLTGVGTVSALSLHFTGGFGAGLVVATLALAIGRRFLLWAVGGVVTREEPAEGGQRIVVAEVNDPGFTGGIVGFGRRAKSLLPSTWLEVVPRADLEAEANRRRWQIETAMPERSLVLTLLWNLFGTFLGTQLLHLNARPLAEALLGHACWMTLWTFASLLVLPAWSRAAVFAADRAVAASGADPRSWIARFPQLVGEDGSPNPMVQTVFYPIPSAAMRLVQLEEGASGFIPGNLARSNLYYSWAAFTLLGRAVHCNVGRPALWVFPPSA